MEMDWAMRGRVQTQIPAFGNWNWNIHHAQPAVKQNFADPAMQDGRHLFRNHFYLGEDNHHLEMFNLPRRPPPPPPPLPSHQQKPRRVGNERRKKKEKEKRHLKDGVVKEQKRLRRVCDETQQRQVHHQLQQQQQQQRRNGTTVKAVDEDLYKIPPELLYQKPKRKAGFCSFWKGCLG